MFTMSVNKSNQIRYPGTSAGMHDKLSLIQNTNSSAKHLFYEPEIFIHLH